MSILSLVPAAGTTGLTLDTREQMQLALAKQLKLVSPSQTEIHSDAAEMSLKLAKIAPSIEEIHFGGNTLGVAASLELADFLKNATSLKVLSSP
ncbi:hypothetical protein K438DRAFT_830854 [Mycena galopus ATCC 62051]|nr:hypothetical protein K438DRAFT_830854 [Mycena galopus ATCC 62051]